MKVSAASSLALLMCWLGNLGLELIEFVDAPAFDDKEMSVQISYNLPQVCYCCRNRICMYTFYG